MRPGPRPREHALGMTGAHTDREHIVTPMPSSASSAASRHSPTALLVVGAGPNARHEHPGRGQIAMWRQPAASHRRQKLACPAVRARSPGHPAPVLFVETVDAAGRTPTFAQSRSQPPDHSSTRRAASRVGAAFPTSTLTRRWRRRAPARTPSPPPRLSMSSAATDMPASARCRAIATPGRSCAGDDGDSTVEVAHRQACAHRARSTSSPYRVLTRAVGHFSSEAGRWEDADGVRRRRASSWPGNVPATWRFRRRGGGTPFPLTPSRFPVPSSSAFHWPNGATDQVSALRGRRCLERERAVAVRATHARLRRAQPRVATASTDSCQLVRKWMLV
jgi:hypothetical protein